MENAITYETRGVKFNCEIEGTTCYIDSDGEPGHVEIGNLCEYIKSYGVEEIVISKYIISGTSLPNLMKRPERSNITITID